MAYLPALASVAFIWFLVVTIPGPNFIVVTRGSMTQTRIMGIAIALGVSMGAGTWATASLLGLNALFNHAGWMYDAIKVVGGCYLVYMGVKTIWHAVQPPVSLAHRNNVPESYRAALQKGLLTSFSNPKTAAFFGSLFVSTFPAKAPLWSDIAAVSIVFVISMIWYSIIACFFSFHRIQTVYKRAKRPLDIMTGLLLSCLGGRLILTKN